tara:strand:- start:1208 stop:2086 length:879 start_codon:yes stop_codon:yes gene_type:complete
MKVLLFGATGMAGTAIKTELLKRNINVIGVSRSGSEISCDVSDENKVESIFRHDQYDALINALAQTDVNRCERDPLESWKINAKIVSILSNFSNELKIPLLQISTDHFYTYGDNHPHKETDPVFFVNEYARHKYAAEFFALSSPRSLVLRTSILGVRQKGENSLLEWAIQSLLQQDEIELFYDAWTSSIDVETFAKQALKLFFDENYRGLLNLASSEVYSKEQLVRKLADMLELDHSKCLSTSVKRISNRANCLGLDVLKAQNLLKEKLPNLDKVCRNLINKYQFTSVDYNC